MDRQHQLPKLTLDSLYSWSNLQQALNNGPMSAPPINNYGGSRGAPSTPNRDDGAGLLGRDRDRDQFFFGHDFTSVFPPLDSSGCGGSGSNKNANNNTNSSEPDLQQQQDFADHFHSLLNLRRSPNPMMMMEPPMSAPPINIRGGGGLLAAGSSSGTHQYKSNNRFVHRSQMKINQPETYSLKVFLGGIPPNLSTNILQLNFAKYGPNFIDWPKKTPTQDRPPNGYAFVVYESDQSIGRMLRECTQSSGGRLIFPVFNLNGVMNQIEVKVWEMKNTTFINQVGWRKFRSYSVFVGGIPRTCTAALLTCAVEETIGPVAYCSIELDQRHFYPKGAACVVFTTKEHYIKAIAAHEVVLSFGTFERKVEFKAFLAANMPCEKCGQTTGTRYCNEMICLAYFCSNCWKLVHNVRPSMSSHQPSRRQSSSGGSK